MDQMAGVEIFKERLQQFMHELECKQHTVHSFESKPTAFIGNDYSREDQILGATDKPMFLARLVLLRPYLASDIVALVTRKMLDRMKWCIKLLRRIKNVNIGINGKEGSK